jgi:transforming growth factor-beta-induced protein
MTKIFALALPLALIACAGDKDGTDPVDTDTTPAETDAPTDTDTTDPVDTDTTDTEDTETPAEPTLVEAVVGTDRFSLLEAAVLRADLAGALTNVTVFAPNDDAFGALLNVLGATSVDDLSVEQLTAVLKYHVVDGVVDSTAAVAAAGTSVGTLGGSLDVAYDAASSVLTVDEATVIMPDIVAADGIIHEIDSVLIPSVADVVSTDPELASLFATITAVDAGPDAPGIAAVFDGDDENTLLAPTNDAFAAFLAANSLADLGAAVDALGLDTLGVALVYHVIPGFVTSDVVVSLDGSSAETGYGPITIDVVGADVVLNEGVEAPFPGVNDARVVTKDILTSNGVIHKIDKVLLPGN